MLPPGYDEKHALSPKEYVSSSHAGNYRVSALSLHCACKLQRRYIVDIVIAQMIVTGVLLFGFSLEVLVSHLTGAK